MKLWSLEQYGTDLRINKTTNGTEQNPEIDSFVYDQLTFNEGAKAMQWGNGPEKWF